MRIGYLECFAGISGDMLLGALLDAGVSPELLGQAARSLNVGSELRLEKVDRSGIQSTKVHVEVDGKLAESAGHHHHHAGRKRILTGILMGTNTPMITSMMNIRTITSTRTAGAGSRFVN